MRRLLTIAVQDDKVLRNRVIRKTFLGYGYGYGYGYGMAWHGGDCRSCRGRYSTVSKVIKGDRGKRYFKT
jgi:hypothetical protein